MDIYGKNFDISELYQPIFGKESEFKSLRNTYDRVGTILHADKFFNNSKILTSSICDVGSNLGHVSFSLEKGGCSGKITGIDTNSQFVEISNHIASSIKSKCSFGDVFQDAEVYLLLSVTHHIMGNSSLDGAKEFFKRIVNSRAHTIYIEQATHLEYPEWAIRLKTKENPITFLIDKFRELTNNEFVVRLVGVSGNHLNTIRPIFQLKRKISEKIVIDGLEYVAYDHFKKSYLGYYNKNIDKEDFDYYFAKDVKGDDVFLKKKLGNWYPIMPLYDGILLTDVLRFGILPFYDMEKIKLQINKIELDKIDYEDFTLWNILVERDSSLRFIDKEARDDYDEKTRRMFNFFTLNLLKVLFY